MLGYCDVIVLSFFFFFLGGDVVIIGLQVCISNREFLREDIVMLISLKFK